MLRTLRIKNYALVDDLEMEFLPGLNIITGATGAGKSIIVGAVNLILGERVSSESIRTGFDTAIVEAIFELPRVRTMKDLLNELGIAVTDDMLLIRREVLSKSQNKCYVNDRMVTLAGLKILGNRLVYLHGQHEHQSLLNKENHIDYLDRYGDLSGVLSRVSETYRSVKDKQKELEELLNRKKTDEERRQLYEFQMQEIEKAGLSVDEEEKLLAEKKVLENVELLYELSSNLYRELYEDDSSIVERVTVLSKELKRGTPIDSRLREIDENLESAVIKLQELTRFLEDYKNRLEFDPVRLEMIRERLNFLGTLKRKYARDIGEILTYREQMKNELDQIVSRDELIAHLKTDLNNLSRILKKESISLSQKRKSSALDLSKKIQKSLADLGMEKTRFEIKVSQRKDDDGQVEMDGQRYLASEKGMDEVEFYVSPNPGEELKPLAKIASGGEISRIMLVIKSILAKTDQVESMIFDEIDVGIGGEVASAVGRALKNLGLAHQVIVITHLQQIASQGDHHFKVFKETKKGRTVTRIIKLDAEERVKEIARMITGEKVSQTTLKQAKEMIRATDTPAHN